jgi:hypothetical protein
LGGENPVRDHFSTSHVTCLIPGGKSKFPPGQANYLRESPVKTVVLALPKVGQEEVVI